MKSTSGKDMEKLSEQLKGLLSVPREERVRNHCAAVTLAMLNCPEHLKGVMFKCNDDAVLAAHKFVLGRQTPCVSSYIFCSASAKTRMPAVRLKRLLQACN
jgi:hypothetical protein